MPLPSPGPRTVHIGLMWNVPKVMGIEVFFSKHIIICYEQDKNIRIRREEHHYHIPWGMGSCKNSQAYYQRVCFLVVVVREVIDILVASCVACGRCDDQLRRIFVEIQYFLSQLFCEISLCLIAWQEASHHNVLVGSLIFYFVLYWVPPLLPLLPGSVFQGVSRVGVKHKNNFIKVSCEVHKFFINPQVAGVYFTHLPVGWGFSAIP